VVAAAHQLARGAIESGGRSKVSDFVFVVGGLAGGDALLERRRCARRA
jgi:hypothetical protein